VRNTRLILSAIAALCVSGCAGRDNKASIERLTRQVVDLKSSFAETDSRVEELGNKLTLLHEKMEASNQAGGMGASPAGASEGDLHAPGLATPPEGLKVVRLGEEPEAGPTWPAMEAGGARNKGAGAPSAREEDPDSLYGRGQDLFISGRYNEARKVFLDLASAYPGHPLADNALYWAGESFYTERDYANALIIFKEAAEKYPRENKAPDALLKAAFSYMELDDRERGRVVIEDLIRRYPGSEAAAKARKTLEKLSGPKKDG
jgi:tol-pal system protein YbgF